MLDIDAGSPYHPNQDPLAIVRVTEALEPLGLVSYVTVASSYSGGLHLYFPFEEPQPSWQVALVLSTLLENSGFKPYPGQLEIFPNPKAYIVEGNPSLFNAHRLPLQPGSYILDEDLQPVSHSQRRFVDYWDYATSKNDLDLRLFKRILKQAKQRVYQLSGKADKFLRDLTTEIETGWTGHGQTNRLLGRITLRTYVFHHILAGGEPLSGDRLLHKVVEIAQSLPGYEDWCRHQHEIHDRALEWVRCVEKSRYFHYGLSRLDNTDAAVNQINVDSGSSSSCLEQSKSIESPARTRITNAIADLLNKNELPIQTTDRFKKLLTYGIGGGSLYRHKDLWHPEFLELDSSDQSNPNQAPKNPTSLFPQNSGNLLPEKDFSDLSSIEIVQDCGNSLDDGEAVAIIDRVSTMGMPRSIAVLSNQEPHQADLGLSSPTSAPLVAPSQTLDAAVAKAQKVVSLRSRLRTVLTWLQQHWSSPEHRDRPVTPQPTPRRLPSEERSFLSTDQILDWISQDPPKADCLDTLWQRFCATIGATKQPRFPE